MYGSPGVYENIQCKNENMNLPFFSFCKPTSKASLSEERPDVDMQQRY